MLFILLVYFFFILYNATYFLFLYLLNFMIASLEDEIS